MCDTGVRNGLLLLLLLYCYYSTLIHDHLSYKSLLRPSRHGFAKSEFAVTRSFASTRRCRVFILRVSLTVFILILYQL